MEVSDCAPSKLIEHGKVGNLTCHHGSSLKSIEKPIDRPAIDKSLISELPSPTLDWHKELLFGLFLFCDEMELRSLAEKSRPGVNSIAEGLKQMECSKKILPLRHLNRNSEPSALTLLPGLLGSFSAAQSNVKEAKENSQQFRKRKNFSSLTLEQVKHKCYSNFSRSSLAFSNATSTSNIKKLKFCSKSKQNAVTEATPTTELITFKPFGLNFNECSLAAISRWSSTPRTCTDDTSANNREHEIMALKKMNQPVPSSLFRKCLTCNHWGHYETECDKITTEHHELFLQIAAATKVQRTLRNLQEYDDLAQHHQSNSKAAEIKRCLDPLTTSSLIPIDYSLPPSLEKMNGKDVTYEFNQALKSNPTSIRSDMDPVIKTSKSIINRRCQCCGSNLRAQDFMSCSACGTCYHYQCLDQSSTGHISSSKNWLCESCLDYDSDVSSIVEIEGCNGFVIEQRKSSSSSSNNISIESDGKYNNGFLCDDDFTAAAILSKRRVFPKSNDDVELRDNNIQHTSTLPKNAPLLNDSDPVIDDIDSIRPSCLSLTGFRKIKAQQGSPKSNNTLESKEVIGVLCRKDDGAVPLFAFPAVVCHKCNGHFPSHMLLSIFQPSADLPSYVVTSSISTKYCTSPSDKRLPPVPWGIFKSFTYTCAHCNEDKKRNVEGTIVFKEDTRGLLTWKEIMQVALLNLMIFANPTQISNKSIPKYLEDKRNRSPNDAFEYHRYFDLDDLCSFIYDRRVYFLSADEQGLSSTSSVPLHTTKMLKENAFQALSALMEDEKVDSIVGDGNLDYYTLTHKGFPYDIAQKVGLPSYLFSIMGACPTTVSVRAMTILKTHPSCALYMTNEQKNRIFSRNKKNTLVEDKRNNAAESSILVSGDLCWAKRSSAPEGMLGRDNWWPSMVIIRYDSTTKREQHNPFVVKFFCLQGGGRVRVHGSDIKPFLPNYENIWRDWMVNQSQSDDIVIFKKALAEAGATLSCPTPAKLLKLARDSRCDDNLEASSGSKFQCPSIRSDVPSLENKSLLGEWTDADATEVDGIVILARPDKQTNSKEGCLESTSHCFADNTTEDKKHSSMIIQMDQNEISSDHKSSETQESEPIRALATSSKSLEYLSNFPSTSAQHLASNDFKKTANLKDGSDGRKKSGRYDKIEAENISTDESDLSKFLHMPLAHDDFIGGVVAWETNPLGVAHEKSRILSSTTIQFGTVLSVSPLQGKALVRTLANIDSIVLSSSTTQAFENDISHIIHSCHLGASIWIPIDSLKFVAFAPCPRSQSFSKDALTFALVEENFTNKRKQKKRKTKKP